MPSVDVPCDLDEHRTYLRDHHRLAAYTRALREVVRPGSIVVDIAAGTGILGILACRAGAARVYAVEQGPIAGVARRIADANGFGGVITVIRDHSRIARLPELADVVVCDQIGGFGIDAGILEIADDARRRFLRAGGQLVPRSVDLFLAPVEFARGRARRRFWRSRPADLDCTAAGEIAENSTYLVRLRRENLLSAPPSIASIDLTVDRALPLHASVATRVEREGVLDGLGGWFAAALSPGVSMTNAPNGHERVRRRHMFFPIAESIRVAAGTAVEASVQMLAHDIFAWQVSVVPHDGAPRTFLHTTARAMLMTKEDLQRTDPRRRPELNEAGAALRTVMTLCDGTRTLAEIEAEVFQRHSDLFVSPAEAAAFVTHLLARNSRS